MQKTINIRNQEKAEAEIGKFKNRKYDSISLKLSNVHLLRINDIIRQNIFSKNDLYVNSETLWEIMQPIGGIGSHHHHGLTPKEIVDVLNSLTNPYCVYKSENNRYAIVSVILSESGKPLMVIIEVGASLVENPKANINKFVTMYPRSNLQKVIKMMNPKDILYRK